MKTKLISFAINILRTTLALLFGHCAFWLFGYEFCTSSAVYGMVVAHCIATATKKEDANNAL